MANIGGKIEWSTKEMASLKKYCFLFAFVLAISIFFNNGTATEEEEETEAIENIPWLTLSLSSLLPSQTCTPFKGLKKNSSLELIQRHGPCSELKHGKANPKTIPTHFDILSEDQARVGSIHFMLFENFSHGNMKQLDSANIPVKLGLPLNTASYIVTVGFGSPKRDLSLVFDVGIEFSWIQCKPCLVKCYNQKEPIFDPSKSSTYSQIKCGINICSQILSTAKYQECPGSTQTCIYKSAYSGTSFSAGFMSKETLTIGAGNTFKDFLFGCGQNNQVTKLGGAAGILGLGRHPISFVQQTANSYNKVFSYCLPPSTSSVGHLTFGSAGVSKNVRYTPITTIPNLPTLHGISITGMIVGGIPLSSVTPKLSSSRAVIDVNALITRLPPSVYAVLRSQFRRMMSMYPMASPFVVLDTCYDVSRHQKIAIPKISLVLGGGVKIDLDASGVVLGSGPKQLCLAFAANAREDDIVILGSVQQKTIEVVYDLNAGKLGFGPPGSC